MAGINLLDSVTNRLTSWLKGTDGAANAHITASDVPFPSQNWLPFAGVAGAADNAILYTSNDVSGYNYCLIENRSAVSIDVLVTADGTFNASQPSHGVVLTDALTGDTVTSITIPTNKSGKLYGKFSNIRVQQAAAGTINADEVVGRHGVI